MQSAIEYKLNLSQQKEQIDFLEPYVYISNKDRMFHVPMEELPVFQPTIYNVYKPYEIQPIVQPASVYLAMILDKKPYYKIGLSKRPHTRIANISGSKKLPVNLLAVATFEDRRDGIIFEDALHALLKRYVFYGKEWYRFDVKQLQHVKTMFKSMAALLPMSKPIEKAA